MHYKKDCIFAPILNDKINMLNLKRIKVMKKVFLFCVVALAFASCTPKAAETAPAADSVVAPVDTTVAPVDTTAVDTTVAPVK